MSAKRTNSKSPSLSKQAKIPKSSLSLESLLDEITKLKLQDEIDKNALKLREDLLNEWNKGKSRDMKAVETYLEAAKVLLTKLTYLPLSHNSTTNQLDLKIARDILEVGAWFSVAKSEGATSSGEMKDFERYLSQLKHYYFDMRKLFHTDSIHMYEILGMNLLYLLSQNRIADFHTELELFIHPNVDEVMQDPYIKKAVEIERYLMEGQYNKIYELKKADKGDLKLAGLTSPGFKYFVDHLENKMRDHSTGIADVIGSAYDKLPMQTAMHMLNLSDSNKMAQIIKEHKWTVKEGYIYFHAKKEFSDTIPAELLLQNALMYTEELDTIV